MSRHRVVLLILLALGFTLPAQAGMTLMGIGATAPAMEMSAAGISCCHHDAVGGMTGHGDCTMSLCQASAITAPSSSRQTVHPQAPRPPIPGRYHSPPITPDTPPPQSALPA